ncbi:MAG: hypothetical protein KAS23_08740, partial [Anaerohalosphaera sp.]|nr:hypothetical protein [Anaerohalosphaera sp.]
MPAKRISCLSILMLFVLGVSSTCQAKSVFAVACHANSKVKAYSIDQDNEITWQATIDETEHFGVGATGFCLWPSKDRMFMTYEAGGGRIAWASIKNLSRDPETDKYDPGMQLAGIEVCESDLLLYAMLRGSNKLYAYSYDEVENILEPVSLSGTTMYRTLSEVGSGVDIAIDPNVSTVMGLPIDRLYVSGVSEDVEYYNMSTWEHEGTITLKQDVVGIGLDRTRGYLYGGYYTGSDTNNKYLLRYTIGGDPNDSETSLEIDLGAQVMDIAVDEETGFIYITTKRNYNNRVGTVEVYDPTDWMSTTDPNTIEPLDTENDSDFGDDGNGPGGIAIGPSFKPGNGMYIDKVDDVDEATEEVVPGDYYYYDIA